MGLGDKFVLNRKFRLDKKTTVAEKVTASFDDVILSVTIPTKKPEGAHRTIPIAVSTTTAASVEAPAADESTRTKRPRQRRNPLKPRLRRQMILRKLTKRTALRQ